MANRSDSSISSISTSDIDLHMSFEVGSFEESVHEAPQNIKPYRFEPEASSSDESDDSRGDNPEDDIVDRVGNTDWCKCNCCTAMPTAKESICCQEVQIDAKRGSIHQLTCITQHPGFGPVCLDEYVLETAYYQNRSQYGELRTTTEERNRYTAYRQLVRWCWGYLGRNVRFPLPACAVIKIRQTFQSNQYRGFQDPE